MKTLILASILFGIGTFTSCGPSVYSVIIRNDGADHEQNSINDMNAPFKKHMVIVPDVISFLTDSDQVKLDKLLGDLESDGLLETASIETKLVAQGEIIDLTKCDNDPIGFVIIDKATVTGKRKLSLDIRYACKSPAFDTWIENRRASDPWLPLNPFFAISQKYRIWDRNDCEDGIHSLEFIFNNEKVLKDQPNKHKLRRILAVCAEI